MVAGTAGQKVDKNSFIHLDPPGRLYKERIKESIPPGTIIEPYFTRDNIDA